MRMPMLRLVLAATLALLATPVLAQDAADKVMALKRDIVQLQNESQLGIANFTLCSKILSYGSYVPRPNAKLKQGESVLFYFEPTNWFTNELDDRFSFYITQDIIIEDDQGATLFSKEKALSFQMNTAKPILDLYVQNDFSLNDAPPGKYIYKAVLHDELKNQSSTATMEFEVVGDEGKAPSKEAEKKR